MTIEAQLARIADALESIGITPLTHKELKDLVSSPPEKPTTETTTEEPAAAETAQVYSLDDVREAVTNFLPDRRDEVVELMAKFGADKIGDFKPDDFPKIIATFNAAYNS